MAEITRTETLKLMCGSSRTQNRKRPMNPNSSSSSAAVISSPLLSFVMLTSLRRRTERHLFRFCQPEFNAAPSRWKPGSRQLSAAISLVFFLPLLSPFSNVQRRTGQKGRLAAVQRLFTPLPAACTRSLLFASTITIPDPTITRC